MSGRPSTLSLGIIVMIVVLLGGTALIASSSQGGIPGQPTVTPQQNNLTPTIGENMLQLRTFNLTATPTNTPPSPTLALAPTAQPTGPHFSPVPSPTSQYCGVDVGMPETPGCICQATNFVYCDSNSDGTCPLPGRMARDTTHYHLCYPATGKWTQAELDQYHCKPWCLAKPIIYLYPEHPMNIDVSLTIPGTVTVSEPTYQENGWQNLYVEPNGTFTYQGGIYHELYYESQLNIHVTPKYGTVIEMRKLSESLDKMTTDLGLNSFEKKEFMDYWVPLIKQKVSDPYLFISVLTTEDKEMTDHVNITPKPDTFISMLFYFRGSRTYYIPEPMNIPSQPQKRNGFTAVEWGGHLQE